MNDLRNYLGEDFDPRKLANTHRLVVDAKKVGEDHLYYETALATSGLDRRYFEFIRDVVTPCEMLDYDCGVGTAGLRMAERYGYVPAFAGKDDVRLEFLKWRVAQREEDWKVHVLGSGSVPGAPYPLVVSFHRLGREKPKDQIKYLEKLAGLGQIVAVNFNVTGWHDGIFNPVDEEAALEFVSEGGHTLLRFMVYNVNWRTLVFAVAGEPQSEVAEEPPPAEPEPEALSEEGLSITEVK